MSNESKTDPAPFQRILKVAGPQSRDGAATLYSNLIRVAYGPDDVQVDLCRLDAILLSRLIAEEQREGGETGEVQIHSELVASVHLPFKIAAELRDQLTEVLRKHAEDNAFAPRREK